MLRPRHLHRIWSTDWRVAREGEIERLQAAYAAAFAKPGRGANQDLKETGAGSDAGAPTRPTPSVTQPLRAAAPVQASFTPSEPVDPSSVTDAMRRDAILTVLREGGAMPPDALIRAAAARVGHHRVGSRIKWAFESVLQRLLTEGRARRLGDRIAPEP
ncbi:MAG: hypothetical protein ABI629_05575 [bacterium]